MKKNNIGIIIGIILSIIAVVAVLSFTSSCRGKTEINTGTFEKSIGISFDPDTQSELYTGTVDLSFITDTNVTEKKIKRIKFDNYQVSMTVEATINGGAKIDKVYYAFMQNSNDITRYKLAIEACNLNGNSIIIEGVDPNAGSLWSMIFPYLIMGVVMLIVIIILSRFMGGTRSATNFAKTNARQLRDLKVRFSDVAGADEEKEELQEVVEFLKNPRKFQQLGARIPRGVLLVGPPGTGKTLFAKAVAGEAGVPFFSISGSDFVEMFVGVGASRVRDLFDTAKKNQPCIVFIDEIDAVGRQRGTGLGGGNDEKEQTLNQLLVQMDGFETSDGIIIMAATNRADILDPALLRPGRFDRQIFVNVPDVKGREAILRVHARNKPMAPDVNFKVVARMTTGFSGADLANLLNEAAILAARANRKAITNIDLYEGINKVLLGPQKKSRLVTESDKRVTAYHESGHAILAKLLPNCNPVHEVSIIPRGQAGGYTMTRPENDNDYHTKAKLLDDIVMTLGGRVAEELVIKDISAGASGDIKAVTKRARLMVTEWGMSDKLGPINYANDQEYFLGKDLTSHVGYSEETAAIIDREISNIINSSLEKARKLLGENRAILDNMARLLVDKETIYGEEVDMLIKGASVEEVEKYIEENEQRAKENPFERKTVIVKEEKSETSESEKPSEENSDKKSDTENN